MKYYFLKRQVKKGEYVLEEYSTENSNLSRRLSKGENIEEEVDLEVYHYDRLNFTDLLDTATFFLVSGKMKNVLEQNCKNRYLNFFEARVVSTVDNSYTKYYLVNLIKNLDAIDYKLSDIDYYEGGNVIRLVKRIELNEKNIGDREIFRLSKLKTEIIISENLKKALENAEITGIKLLPVEAYRE